MRYHSNVNLLRLFLLTCQDLTHQGHISPVMTLDIKVTLTC